MTTTELARIIGVSRITLSKVINKKGGVSAETEARIQEYIKKYNFEPNSQARSLVGKKEQIIGFFTTYSNDSSESSHVTSHLATELTNLVINAAQKRGYKTLVAITQPNENLDEIEKLLNSGLLRGAILFGYETGNKKIEKISSKGIPLVLINQEEKIKTDNISIVNMNDEQWAFYAIEKLVQLNHKKILYLGCSRKRLPALRRKNGVSKAYKVYHDKIELFMERNADFNEDLAYSIVKDIFTNEKELPTGIFAANDLMAIGAINALKDLGVQVPRDVSVIGFDDISISKYLSPALTTIRCNFNEIAQKSVNTLIDSIEGIEVTVHQELELEFIERESLTIAKQ
mgnify:CR=1 FL=1|nr:LacI family DNA-binding transcriptional regulator [uncultured Lachnoclostridium sp.]